MSILKTRKAPGYSASNPTLLETRPRRGYRFIAPVTVEIILSLTLGKHDNPIIRILLANRGLPRTPVEGIRLAYVHYCDSELPSSVLPEMRVEPKRLRPTTLTSRAPTARSVPLSRRHSQKRITGLLEMTFAESWRVSLDRYLRNERAPFPVSLFQLGCAQDHDGFIQTHQKTCVGEHCERREFVPAFDSSHQRCSLRRRPADGQVQDRSLGQACSYR